MIQTTEKLFLTKKYSLTVFLLSDISLMILLRIVLPEKTIPLFLAENDLFLPSFSSFILIILQVYYFNRFFKRKFTKDLFKTTEQESTDKNIKNYVYIPSIHYLILIIGFSLVSNLLNDQSITLYAGFMIGWGFIIGIFSFIFRLNSALNWQFGIVNDNEINENGFIS